MLTPLPVFSEVIQVLDGDFCDLAAHISRMRHTTACFFGKQITVDLDRNDIPENLRRGLVKCRIEYGDAIRNIDFSLYTPKTINRVAVVECDRIDYSFKYADRTPLQKLLDSSGCDEIVVVRNGLVTDSSFSNLVFENKTGFYTPDTFLLAGTQRKTLLERGEIKTLRIPLTDIRSFSNVYFINAMLDLSDRIGIPVNRLVFPGL